MSKKLHIVCNAHLDPVWQWEWEEGAAEALSTFRIAVGFCEEYNNFVFCHNEALLYKWIEEYDPTLFERIKTLVKAGKWHIMGGWHIQPDCNMPCGEAFVRQIASGRKYFLEKFSVAPKVAVNVDPFGHSRGLVQIMKKCGYEGYLFMRPSKEWITLSNDEFRWIGYDGSEMTAIRIKDGYNSGKGKAAQKIENCINNCADGDLYLCLWGIGNHGGGPSKKDIEDINVLTEEMKRQDVEIIQSTPEKYLDAIKDKDLPSFDKSLNPWAVGCYTSQVRIKQRYRRTENEFFMVESMCSHASLEGLIDYPAMELESALYDLLTVQFHDMLPGSSIQPAEEMSLRMLDHSLEILTRLKARAFFALTKNQKKPPEDRIPIFAYNPYPYPLKGDHVCEFMLWDQDWNDEFLQPIVYDENDNIHPSQCEKENSTIPLEWRKRVVFSAELKPMSVTRFECGFKTLAEKPAPSVEQDEKYYYIKTANSAIKISKETGLVDCFEKDGVSYLYENAMQLQVFDDNYDPWFMEQTHWKNQIGAFSLLNNEEAAELCALEKIEPVHIIESGDVRTVIEALFVYNKSNAILKYIVANDGSLQIQVRIVWNEKQKLVKLNVPTTLSDSVCIGEEAYGREELKNGFEENVSQKYTAVCGSENALLAVNDGSYGSSFDNGELKITLLRSPSYCAHPIDGRRTMPSDRCMPHIEQGERDFSFLFKVGEKENILNSAARTAMEFGTKPMLLSLYPSGYGKEMSAPVVIEDNDIITLNAFKKAENGDGYILRLFNPTDKAQKATIRFYNQKTELSFGKFEIKSVRYFNGELKDTDLID